MEISKLELNGSIIQYNTSYNSITLNKDINSLRNLYSFIEVGSIGKSVLGKDIPFIKIGNGSKEVFYSASYHANEWITSIVLMKFLEDYCYSYKNNLTIFGYSARDLFNVATIYLVPMVNPDGVDLVTGEIKPDSSIYNSAKAISDNYPSIPFVDGWKANIRGIDLNLQFPAGWQNAKEIKFSQGYTSPAPCNFVGFGPLTEPESLNVYNFTLEHNFRLILAYHSQGEVIFWQFQNYNPYRSLEIGQQLSNANGYSLESTPYNSSFAGYKDWFIQNYNRPGYTIEVGLGVNPLPISQFEQIYSDNLGILVLGAILA